MTGDSPVPQQPPLPPDPPALGGMNGDLRHTSTTTTNNAACTESVASPPSMLPGLQSAPPIPSHQQHQQQQTWYDTGVPHISVLLYQEAEAWRTLTQLHRGVMCAARQLTAVISDTSERIETAQDAIASREYAYCTYLTNIALQCDYLSTEALRLRTLRKTRTVSETHVLHLLLQTHSEEAISVGTALASQTAISVQTLVVELRQSIQSTKTQIARLRTALQALQDNPRLGGDLCLTVRSPNEGAHAADEPIVSLAKLFHTVYEGSDEEEVTDEALIRALEQLHLLSPPPVDEHVAASASAEIGGTARVSSSSSSSSSTASMEASAGGRARTMVRRLGQSR